MGHDVFRLVPAYDRVLDVRDDGWVCVWDEGLADCEYGVGAGVRGGVCGVAVGVEGVCGEDDGEE